MSRSGRKPPGVDWGRGRGWEEGAGGRQAKGIGHGVDDGFAKSTGSGCNEGFVGKFDSNKSGGQGRG